MKLSLIIPVFLVACAAAKPAEPQIVVSEPDGGVEMSGPADVVAACLSLQNLGCPEGGPSPQGIACTTYLDLSRPYVNVACIGSAKTKIELITKCNVRCRL